MDMDEVRIKIRDLRIMKGLDDPLVEKLTDLLQSISAPRVVPAGGVTITSPFTSARSEKS